MATATDASWVYFEAYLGTDAHPQACNVWGWSSHAEAQAAMCEFIGEPMSEAVDQLFTTLLCVDYDSHGINKGERATVLTIRKALSTPDGAHPILAETTTRLKEALR
jgi:hypothetical protein